MIKAEAQITIYDVNDGERGPTGVGIKSYTRYYKIASSTTTPHFDESWTVTEPSYDGVSTNSLYFIDKIVYSDGNISWSQVSKLSSYEAAKAAWNKANEANKFWISGTEPEDKTKLWLDTSVDPAVIKQYDHALHTWNIVNDQSMAFELLYKNIYSEIDKSASQILVKVGEETYSKAETNTLIGNMNTQYTQDKNSFEFKFQEFRKELGDLSAETDLKFTDIEKYIRFEDGAIVIGIKGNPIILKMKNDRISFTENGAEVAYISNHRMFITELEVMTAFYIGNFAFIPRENGNLSFKKVRG